MPNAMGVIRRISMRATQAERTEVTMLVHCVHPEHGRPGCDDLKQMGGAAGENEKRKADDEVAPVLRDDCDGVRRTRKNKVTAIAR